MYGTGETVIIRRIPGMIRQPGRQWSVDSASQAPSGYMPRRVSAELPSPVQGTLTADCVQGRKCRLPRPVSLYNLLARLMRMFVAGRPGGNRGRHCRPKQGAGPEPCRRAGGDMVTVEGLGAKAGECGRRSPAGAHASTSQLLPRQRSTVRRRPAAVRQSRATHVCCQKRRAVRRPLTARRPSTYISRMRPLLLMPVSFSSGTAIALTRRRNPRPQVGSSSSRRDSLSVSRGDTVLCAVAAASPPVGNIAKRVFSLTNG